MSMVLMTLNQDAAKATREARELQQRIAAFQERLRTKGTGEAVPPSPAQSAPTGWPSWLIIAGTAAIVGLGVWLLRKGH